jgi:hypothetical protein
METHKTNEKDKDFYSHQWFLTLPEITRSITRLKTVRAPSSVVRRG